ncbi:recombinase RecT [Mesoaciditoga sp.]
MNILTSIERFLNHHFPFFFDNIEEFYHRNTSAIVQGILVMSKGDVEKIRKRSKSPNFGPWVTDYDAMARKAAIKQLCKYLPISVEIQKAIAADETTKRGISQDMVEDIPDETDWEVIQADYEGVPEENEIDDNEEGAKDVEVEKVEKAEVTSNSISTVKKIYSTKFRYTEITPL